MEVLRSAGRFLSEGTVEGRRVIDVRRVGKLIIITLDDGTCVRSHLAMSGLWSSREEPWSFDYVEARRVAGDERHARLVLHTDHGAMVYHDQRMFGRMTHGPTADADGIPGRGYEWVSTDRGMFDEVDVGWLEARLEGMSHLLPLRSMLCDQGLVPGIGNIYSAEIMWRMRMHPLTPLGLITHDQLLGIIHTAGQVLREAIARSLDYSDLAVYRRIRCPDGHPVSSLKIEGRTVYACETCQEI